jgi:hypothetical protein
MECKKALRELIRINKVKLAIFEAIYDVIGVAH